MYVLSHSRGLRNLTSHVVKEEVKLCVDTKEEVE